MKQKTIKFVTAVLAIVILILVAGFLFRQMTNGGKMSEEEAAKQQEKEDSIKGQWKADDDFYCDIWRDESGVFHADVTLTEGPDTVSFWECSGNWVDGENGFTYRNGTRVRYNYAGSKGEASEILYEEGEGLFYLRNGVLFWNDKKENAADGKSFTYVGEY